MSQVSRSPSGHSYSIVGFNECQACGNRGWEFGSDANTGSTMKFCTQCGAGVIINRGYIDPNLGVALDRPNTVGSWCSYSAASGWLRYE